MIPPDQLTNPTARALITAADSNGPSAFRSTHTLDAKASDDGSDEHLARLAPHRGRRAGRTARDRAGSSSPLTP